MIRILFIVGLILFLGVQLHRFYARASAAGRKFLKRLLLTCAIIFVLYLTATGRLAWLIPLIGAVLAIALRALPHIFRLMPLFQRLWVQHRVKKQQTEEENTSVVETEFVRMELDHDRNEISGEVLKGRFAGRRFNELDLKSLLELREEVMGLDRDSVALIESYLDRIHRNDWRKAGSSQEKAEQSRGRNKLTREEALEILGLKADSSPNDIIAAHRRLIQKMHPDRGGSDYLAAKINQAREVLLS
ncbi:MAG: molecular chaperone DnaJ [Methylococcales bacterium]